MTAAVPRDIPAQQPLPGSSPEAQLLHFAAEAHRRKWAFAGDPAAFDALHRLGGELLATYRASA